MELKGMTLFQLLQLLQDASVKRYKAINGERIASAHMQSVVLVSKYYLSTMVMLTFDFNWLEIYLQRGRTLFVTKPHIRVTR